MIVFYEWLLAAALVGLQVVLFYLLAPPRIGVLGRLVTSPVLGDRLVRLTIQSMELRDSVGPFRVRVRTRGGDFLASDAVDAYVGTHADADAVRVTEEGLQVRTVEVTAIRPMKSWVVELPVTSTTEFIEVDVSGPRRNVGAVIPVLRGSILGEVDPRSDFHFAIRIPFDDEAGGQRRERPRLVDPFGDFRVPFTVLASVAAGYCLLVIWFGQAWQAWDRELGAVAVLVVAAGVLYWLTRPEPPVVAQGYRDPQRIKVHRATPANAAASAKAS